LFQKSFQYFLGSFPYNLEKKPQSKIVLLIAISATSHSLAQVNLLTIG